jgi:CxxC motif-containing protein (DUF1111 family)
VAAVAVAISVTAPAGAGEAEVRRGKLLFDRPWRAPAGQDPVGPLFNARSCGECHPGGDAGAPDGPALVLRTGGHPVLGLQLQPRAIAGATAEPAAAPAWEMAASPGGPLRRPRWALDGGPLAARLAPDLRGVGLLARIPEGALLAAADPEDGDGDGVSGRVRWLGALGGRRPGRFGRKAQHATLAAQVADALAVDMGIASAGRPAPAGDCTPAQRACLALAGAGAQVPAPAFDRLLAYVAGLRPRPAPALDGRQGEALFTGLGCAACHGGPFAVASDPAVTGRPTERIAPFSDLLLYDLGPDLADPLPDRDPLPSEWRTAPLWGLRHRAALLHDGRAADPREAVLWHGGEAAASREGFLALAPPEQAALLGFLAGL